MEFIDYNQVNIDTLTIKAPIFDSIKGIFISALTNDGSDVCIDKVVMKLKSIHDNELELEFIYSDNDLYKFVHDIERYCKNQIIINGSNWFGRNLNEDTINNIYKISISLPDKIPALPYMTFICNEDCKISRKRKKIEFSDLKPNMEIEIGFCINGIQYYKNKCGLCYCLNYIKVINDICQSFDCLFENEDDDDSEISD